MIYNSYNLPFFSVYLVEPDCFVLLARVDGAIMNLLIFAKKNEYN